MNKNLVPILVVAGLLLGLAGHAAFAQEPDLVAIKSVDKSIMIDLRYATTRNIAGHPFYPPDMPALIRPQVAAQLAKAQKILHESRHGLKIWDAYRPKSAHDRLWQFSRNAEYVADPAAGGSIHTCGAAVDATLVDSRGRDVAMPTDFDDFTVAAMLHYTGNSVEVRRNLYTLQNAMARAGFYGQLKEWWHFVAKDWQNYPSIPEVMILPRSFLRRKPARAVAVRPAESVPDNSPRPSGGNPASPPSRRAR